VAQNSTWTRRTHAAAPGAPLPPLPPPLPASATGANSIAVAVPGALRGTGAATVPACAWRFWWHTRDCAIFCRPCPHVSHAPPAVGCACLQPLHHAHMLLFFSTPPCTLAKATRFWLRLLPAAPTPKLSLPNPTPWLLPFGRCSSRCRCRWREWCTTGTAARGRLLNACPGGRVLCGCGAVAAHGALGRQRRPCRGGRRSISLRCVCQWYVLSTAPPPPTHTHSYVTHPLTLLCT
jgi:hypothetical protein